MDHDVKMLQELCQCAQWGQNDLRAAMKKADDPAMRQALSSQLREYEAIHRQAQRLLADRGCDEKKISPLLLTLSRMDAGRKMAGDSPAIAKWMTEHHARILPQNRDTLPLDPKVSTLSNRLLQTEQETIGQMRPFLS
ncbi:MAG: hypothetical protein E7464_01850 [Ruminococcaceae bacterium]|nr:hypothetical protein [Oscillospiraceae bacterium]